MAKHQRRSHQTGIDSELKDGDSSYSNTEECSFTSQSSGPMHLTQELHVPQQKLPERHQMRRTHSFNDFGQHQIGRHCIEQQFTGHGHNLLGGAQKYNGSTEGQELHYPIMYRAPSLPAHAPYHVMGQDNADVATLNTISAPIQTAHTPHELERRDVLQSSRSSYSSASRANPVSQAPFYINHPAAQPAMFARQNSSPNEQRMVQYQQQMLQCLMQHHDPPKLISQAQSYEQYYLAQLQERPWYDNTGPPEFPH